MVAARVCSQAVRKPLAAWPSPDMGRPQRPRAIPRNVASNVWSLAVEGPCIVWGRFARSERKAGVSRVVVPGMRGGDITNGLVWSPPEQVQEERT